jgi:peptidoglycan-N-acetylglucosamine deacetylase
MRRGAPFLVLFGLFAFAVAAQSSHDADPAAKTIPVAELPALNAHPVVALTFDDLPGAGVLPANETRTAIMTRLADELKNNGLAGTYGFVNGAKIGNDEDEQRALRAWVAAGMNIGSHTWSHISLSNSAEAFEEEIAKNEATLTNYAEGRDWHWFRYPFLWEGDTL